MDKTMTNTRNKGWEPKDGDVCFNLGNYENEELLEDEE